MASELAACLAADAVVIFSYGGCPYCRKVTQEYKSKEIAFREIDYDELDDGEAVRAEILRAHKQKSVPAVFVKGKFVGGCNDGPEPGMGALPLLASGKLAQMLAA
eukprot:CAMPEP_0197582586 /NCGR_PEP_ID=MMETSP1326-20131121/5760_1 /TAXON_ID=1155430 /ORGANISM="Genus nov. species nov., Strain RCC2288" /LENGTH=104 /DNA_ID=CAMNT_0043146691 /DNA_START=66 /DNA_END=380 /DNA_ORIENTATION=+